MLRRKPSFSHGGDKTTSPGALQLSLPRTLQRVSNPTGRARKQNLGCQLWVPLAPSRDTNLLGTAIFNAVP